MNDLAVSVKLCQISQWWTQRQQQSKRKCWSSLEPSVPSNQKTRTQASSAPEHSRVNLK